MAKMIVAMIFGMACLFSGVLSAVTMSTNPDALSWTGVYTPSVRKGTKLYSVAAKVFLRLKADGKVDGTADQSSEYVKLELQSVDRTLKRIKGVKIGKFVGMNAQGRLFTTTASTLETIFMEEQLSNGYTKYSSFKYYNRNKYDALLAFRKNGMPQRGTNTRRLQNSTYFLQL